ncbi:MAG TPA: hypothetical protein VHB51_02515 [Candidatus Saccharimonadales bacterium]|nr:hypothetical protein [Candidatus Saccharimonadales bacterium]
MSNAGMSNYKGVNYQAWAALLLFLLRANDSAFESITLEDVEWEDFTLKYSNGKKIICESKFRSEKIKPSLVKEILQNIAAREGDITETDEILIICPEVDEELESNVRYYKWDPERIGKWFKEKGFSEESIKLVSRLSFFKAPSAEYLYNEAISYFYNLNEVGHAWLPQSEVDAWLKKTLVDEVHTKSESGTTFTRAELQKIIDDYFHEKIQNNPVYDAEQSEVKEQYATLLKDIAEKNTKAIQRDLTVLSAQPQLMYIAIDTIFKTPDATLRDWDVIWSHLIDRQYWFRIVHEFKGRTDAADNASYILDLFNDHVDAFINPALDDFRSEYSIQIIIEIIDKHPDLAPTALKFAEEFLKRKKISYQDLDQHDSKQEKVEIANLLEKLYDQFHSNSDNENALKVIELATQNFSLIDDDGKYFIYTPAPIFAVLQKYLGESLDTRLSEITELVTNQFNGHKYFKGEYKGWDATGSGLSQFGSEFSIDDKHFIQAILMPVLSKEYEEKPAQTWKLVEENLLTTDPEKITAKNPDYLNRAVIPVLLKEYVSGENSEDAKKHLIALSLMKGVPAKFELIFQKVRDYEDMSDDQKWSLVKPFLDHYKLPITVFVEQIVSDLAVKGHKEAIATIKEWVADPDYREQQRRHSFFIAQSMFKLLATDPNSDSFKTGIEIFEEYIASEDFTSKLDSFDSYDISRALARIIEVSYDDGLAILKAINSNSTLTRNQQTLVWLSLEQVDKTNKELIKKLYDDFVKPTLIDELNADSDTVEAKYTEPYGRELAVQFAEHLAELNYKDEGMQILSVFIADSDPPLTNKTDDPDGTFNYHERIKKGDDVNTINTVRGWTAWALRQYCGTNYRDKIDSTIDMVWQLACDENLYVRTMSTFPMIELMKNRHTVMPGTDDRFVPTELAEKIETMALNFLEDNDNPVILSHMVHVMQNFHTLTTDQALMMFEKYGLTDLKPVSDDIVLLLPYFAFWRKNDFIDEKCRKLFGDEKYEAINNFDDKPFIDLLKKCIDQGDDELRTQIGWYFWTLPKKNAQDFEKLFQISYDYMTLLAGKYSREAFSRIGYFIRDHIETKTSECLELWEKVIVKERDWLIANAKNMQPHEWWTHHHNADFLIKMREVHGDERYLDNLEVLLGYPEKFQPMLGPDVNYNILVEINNPRAQAALEKLKSIYPQLYAKDS